MSVPAATPPLLPPREKTVVLQPGFLRAWQGIWLFTWKSQFTWRRLPGLLVTLLAIPLLACFTIEPLKQLTSRYDWRVEPQRQLNEFKASAASSSVPLPRGFSSKLTQIIAEEQNRVQPAQPSDNPASRKRISEEAIAGQIEQARACSDRIGQRVQPLLDARQSELFRQFQQRKLEEAFETIRKFNLQELRPFYRWLVDFYFLLVLPLYCLAVCGSNTMASTSATDNKTLAANASGAKHGDCRALRESRACRG